MKQMGGVYLRLLSGVPAFVGLLGLFVYASTQTLAWCMAVVSPFACREVWSMARKAHVACSPRWLLVGGGGLASLGALWLGERGLLLALTLSAMGMLVHAWLQNTSKNPTHLHGVGLGLAGLMLGGTLPAYGVLLAQLPHGRLAMVLMFCVVSANDTFAYAGGRLFGRRPLAVHISPKKTVEGLVFGVLSGGLMGWLFALWLASQPEVPTFTPWALVGVGLLVALLAQAGDLLISTLKRCLQAKDTGRFLPGHGGLLDRLDAYLLVLPILYFAWSWYLA